MLLHIPREIFLKELGHYFYKKYTHRLQVLQTLPAFQHWPIGKLRFLCQVLYERTVHLGNPIAKENKNVENRFFVNILRRGHIRIDKTINPLKNGPQQLQLCMLSPGSILFEPKLVQHSLEHMIEAAKIDRGENSTVRWTFSAFAQTSVLLWCISRHTYYNIDVNTSETLFADLEQCKIQVPPMSVLEQCRLQQEEWSTFKARSLVDVYSKMSDQNRKKLAKNSQKNEKLLATEHGIDQRQMEQFMMDTPMFEHQNEYLNTNFKELSRGGQQRRRVPSTEEIPAMVLYDRRRRLLSKGDDSTSRGSEAKETELQYTSCNDKRAVSAQRKRRQFNAALQCGQALTPKQRAEMRGGSMLPMTTTSTTTTRSTTRSIPTVQELLDTQPFVQNCNATINSLQHGLINTAHLQSKIEGHKYTYRVPTCMGMYAEGKGRWSPVVPNRRKLASGSGSSGGGATCGSPLKAMRTSRIRVPPSVDETHAMYHGGQSEIIKRGRLKVKHHF